MSRNTIKVRIITLLYYAILVSIYSRALHVGNIAQFQIILVQDFDWSKLSQTRSFYLKEFLFI